MGAGTIIASVLIDRAAVAIMNDRNKVRFTAARGLEWLNEAQRYVAGVNPSANAAIVVLTLAAGVRQAVPVNAHEMIAPKYNVNGTTPGRNVSAVDVALLDSVNPNWRLLPQSGAIRHVVQSITTPAEFEVYPPAVAGTKLAAELALIPADILSTDPITLEDTYEGVIIDYMCYRFYSKDAEYAGNADLALKFMNSVNGKLGGKSQADTANDVAAHVQIGKP